MSKKLLPAVCVVAAAVLGVSACGGGNPTSQGEHTTASPSASPSSRSPGQADTKQSMPQPDLKGIPAVVATVNGQKISKGRFVRVYASQFQQLAMQSQMSGQRLDQPALKKQVAQSMVGSTLLTQAANKSHYAPSRADVNRTLNDLAQQNGMKSGQQLMRALTQQGHTKQAILTQVKEQAKVNHLVAEGAGRLEPSRHELKQAYRQLSRQADGSQAGSKAPSFQKVRPQLVQQLKAQKRERAAQTVVQRLRKRAHVTINL